ncbi:MAG TPA: Holliday junction branch migration protein RuvA [Candidatus Paceibacterota bacterium]|nr:Holliday junction branch migration protein RuvA [Candidatus Paceibacterota bacterium]
MIGYIDGTVRAIRDNHCVVETGGVGYKLFTTKETLSKMTLGLEISFWVHTAVREDALDLYGFPDENELQLFEMLITVSGIGPRSALGVLDAASAESVRAAIATGNASYLTGISGIGKKTSEKIVLELKDKLPKHLAITAMPKGDLEALEAMRSLGYSADEARTVLRQVDAQIEGSGERLREALRLLGARK